MTNPSLSIRAAISADIDGICSLSQQINQQHHLAAPQVFVENIDPTFERIFWKARLDLPENVHLIAEIGGVMIGYITASINETMKNPFLHTNKICRIGTIVVDQHHHHTGIGKAMMDAACQWGKQNGAAEVRLEVFDFNSNAIQFYDSLGFGMQSHIMHKTL
ncbi:GNAT family N-acetyltransferase [Undibacterium sp. Ji67W]|uniref:GNAT family N-acetyltransferase n=1 Tax=Undibacterium sp. Ji67W TaxID=3413042 RepID=UPI003BF1E3A2